MRKLSSLMLQGFLARRRTSKFDPRYVSVRLYCNKNDSGTPSLSKRPGPLSQYKALVEKGKLKHDPYQEEVACKLDSLLDKLEQYERDMEEYHVKLNEWEQTREDERRSLLMAEAEVKQQGGGSEAGVKKQNAVQKWFSRNTDQISAMLKKKKLENMESGVGKWVSYLNRERRLDNLVGRKPTAPAAPKGLYLYGNVGSGKTMLMDLFYSSTEGIVKHRRRFHFHEAMLDINERMHKIWKSQVEEKSSESGISTWISNLPFDTKIKEWLAAEESFKQEMQLKNILPAVADKFLVESNGRRAGASILCFDEIQTVDVFAIVALSGILSRLLSTGTILVATSNRAPWELNQDGMQKEIFQKLVHKLDEQCHNVFIGSEIDYRRQIAKRPVDEVLYFWPLDSAKAKEFANAWEKLTYGKMVSSTTIKVMFGRTLEVPQCCDGIAHLGFEYLCGRPLGAADYIAVAKNFHTVFISEIPAMNMEIRDKARRFITLIDEMYNHHCCVYCSAAAPIDELFQGTEEGALLDLESFQFETEMEDSKLRQDVLSPGTVSSGGSPAGIVSMLSGQEEMFAFRRAVSRLIEMQSSVYLEGTAAVHPYFQRRN